MQTQDIIHKFEEGAGMVRWRNRLLAGLILVALIFFCNWRYFRNFSTQEAMDSAQVARNISEGNGYTTLFVRPFSMYLLSSMSKGKQPQSTNESGADYSYIRTMQPDVSNPPLYPVALAGWTKVYHGFNTVFDAVRKVMPGFIRGHMPQLDDSPTNPIWMSDGGFSWNPPDFYIGIFNEILFFCIIVLTFRWAKRLFDSRVAWTSAVLLFCSDFLWQFTMSGLSTMLLLLIFTGMAWCLTLFDLEMREPKTQSNRIFMLAAVIGLLTGLGGMTRYGFLLAIVPVIAFMMIFGGQRRVVLSLVTICVFVLVTTPWLVRNYKLTGTLFGTSTYAATEGVGLPGYAAYQLERSLNPTPAIYISATLRKLIVNSKSILETDFPTLGNSWVAVLFMAGLLIGFRNPAIRRIRYFVMMSLGAFVVAQAVGHTQLTDDSPVFNSENYLVLLVPLVTVYGVSLFFVLFDQMTLPLVQLRYLVVTIFGFITCAPFLFAMAACLSIVVSIKFLPQRPGPESRPYKPGVIQIFSKFMKPDELIMSDMPWAVAWYGHRQSIWLTRDVQTYNPQTDDPHWADYQDPLLKERKQTEAMYPDFFYVNDFQKHISAIYLTTLTTDRRFLSEWFLGGEKNWATFVLQILTTHKTPEGFPLKATMDGMLPVQLFLSDWERWRQ